MPEKIQRDAFLYMEPKPPKGEFAQCSTCFMWIPESNTCAIHGEELEVQGTDSCGLYVHGESAFEEAAKLVTEEESGLVTHPVRCENCYYGGKECGLYVKLNKALPELFDLDTKISPQACCNGQTPKEAR